MTQYGFRLVGGNLGSALASGREEWLVEFEEAGRMETVADCATGGSSSGFLSDLTPNEYKTLVESGIPLRGSVVRIIQVCENEGAIGTGTTFLVYKDDKRGLFLTCEHNFVIDQNGTYVIRFPGGDEKDYPIEGIFNRDRTRDILLFSVKDIPDRKCLQISTDKIKSEDKVVMIGHVSPDLSLNNDNDLTELVLVKQPAVIPGEIICEPFKNENDEHHEMIFHTCEASRGCSGGPLLKDEKVAEIHLASDKLWREAVSVNTVLYLLRGWLRKGENNNDTFEELLTTCAREVAKYTARGVVADSSDKTDTRRRRHAHDIRDAPISSDFNFQFVKFVSS